MENVFKNRRTGNKTTIILAIAVLFFVLVGIYSIFESKLGKSILGYDELVDRARQASDAGNYAESIDYYKEAIGKDGGNNQAKSEIATVYIKNQNYDEAISALSEVIQTDETNSFALNNLGNAYRDKGEVDLAEKYYQLSIARGNVDSVGNLVTMYNNAGKFDKSISLLDSMINGGKNDNYFLRLLASTYSKKGDGLKAEETLAKIKK